MDKMNIIVVEDDQSINELIRYNLERSGFAAEGIANGMDAVHLIERRLPSLVLLDIMLPGLDGL